MAEEPWWQAAFQADYLTLYAHRSDAQAAAEVAGVLPRLRAAGPVLDACCGAGRHIQALRAAGVQAFGFDYSADLLQAARQRPGLSGGLLRADVRRIPLRGGWGAITLFFTAFGYFDEGMNRAALQHLGSLLRPGGWLLVDLPEPERVRAGLVPESQRQAPDGRLLRERRRLVGPRVEKEVTILQDGQEQRRYTESVRLYETEEIRELAEQAGCRLQETWPSLAGPNEAGDRAVRWLQRV